MGVRTVAMEGVERGHGHKDRSAAKPCKSLPVGDLLRIILQGTRRYAWRHKSPEKNVKKISPGSRTAPEIGQMTESEVWMLHECREHSELTGLCTKSIDRFCCGCWPCGEVVRRGAAVHLSTGRRPVASKRVTRPSWLLFRSVGHRPCSGPDGVGRGRRPAFRRDIRAPESSP